MKNSLTSTSCTKAQEYSGKGLVRVQRHTAMVESTQGGDGESLDHQLAPKVSRGEHVDC